MILFLYLIAFFIFFFVCKKNKIDCPVSLKLAICLLALLTLIKGTIAFQEPGYINDINTFKSWGSLVNTHGFSKIYQLDIFLDYPPAYLYILSALDGIRQLFSLGFDSPLYTMIIKLPGLLFEMGTAIVLYQIAKEKFSSFVSFGIAAFYCMNPVLIMNSAIWGQVDAVYLFFVFVGILLLQKNKINWGCFVYGIAILFKPQAILFGPVYLFLVLQKKSLKTLLLGLGFGALAIVLFVIPFCWGFDFTWLFKLYGSTLTSYPYATVNAFNLYGLLGKNWVELAPNIHTIVNVVVILSCSVVTGWLLWIKKKDNMIWINCFLMIFAVFAFTTKMHERYLYPAILFLFLTYITTKDDRWVLLGIGITVVQYLNVKIILDTLGSFLLGFDPQVVILSAGLLILFVYFIFLIVSTYKGANKKLNFDSWTLPSYTPSSKMSRFTKKDGLCLLAIVVFYSCFAFYQLGSNKIPTSYWQPEVAQDGFILELEQGSTFDAIYFMSGIGNSKVNNTYAQIGSNFKLEGSDNLEQWSEIVTFENKYIYDWNIEQFEGSYRYIRLTALNSESVLNEIAFKVKGEERFIPVSLYSLYNYAYPHDPSAAIDEQALVPIAPTYMNTTYFDEIYHARTAVEMLNNYRHYEWTHPPLGKIFIATGIQLFGLSPFGWRFAGVFFGILMLPFLYGILKQLFNKTSLASVGTFMFAFDFMHFTQTRIATIDTYAVFFILAMYYFMIRYIKLNFYEAKPSQIFFNLALSGLFMGLGWASKWTVIYASIGLALLFFINFGQRCYEYYVAQKAVRQKKANELQLHISKTFVKKATQIIAFCVLMFILVPAIIYVLSYIPFFNIAQDNNGIKEFFQVQQNMFNYHYQLVSEHFFSSQWFEWPLMIKPIWYDVTMLKDNMVSTISSFGNPMIWWPSIITLIATAIIGFKKRDYKAFIILTGYLSSYLPWVFVPRLTFIYHYFTAVPFALISMVYCFNELLNKDKRWKIAIILCAILTFVLFIYFFPVLSGSPASYQKIQSLEWFKSWFFVN